MIHILWPTIRPYVFANSYKIWIEKSTNKDITTHVCINDFFTNEEKAIVRKAIGQTGKILEINQTRFGVCQKAYELSSKLEANDDDIVVFASDDFLPPNDWDNYIVNKLKDKQGCLMVRDGYQLPDSSNMLHPCITIPIMTYGCLKQLNKVIYHPAYYHMFSDCELYLNLKELGLLIDDRLTDMTVFEHHHYAAGKRNADQNDVNYNVKWIDDDKMWKKRSVMSVTERIKV
jgi:hypothetical protein